MSSLSGKTIVVTGVGQGIGRDIVTALINLNVKVIGISRSSAPLNDLKTQLNSPNFTPIQLDLSDWNQTRDTLQSLDIRINGIVNNAGIAVIKPFEELTENDYDMTMDVNLKACFNVIQSLLPKLENGSAIVNLSSVASLKALADHTIYCMSKAGLDALTRNLALELAPRNIRVNSVNPTVILTRMGRENWSDPQKAGPLLSRIPLNRFGEVKEVVDPVIWLLSDESSYINGHCLPIEGGLMSA
ncbi:L-xylulose reductase [Chironomus tepperi]|uniref:L-xylulose reductase n=1 Tax=Chironomus tepperi TaxID=113505 RepID=UPI00391EF36F